LAAEAFAPIGALLFGHDEKNGQRDEECEPGEDQEYLTPPQQLAGLLDRPRRHQQPDRTR
jgi:hypothetical protein